MFPLLQFLYTFDFFELVAEIFCVAELQNIAGLFYLKKKKSMYFLFSFLYESALAFFYFIFFLLLMKVYNTSYYFKVS